jgi:uncharacterized protein YecT (DUF1311 family)
MKELIIAIVLLVISAPCAAESCSTAITSPLVKKLDTTCRKILRHDNGEYITFKTNDQGSTQDTLHAQYEWNDCQDKFLNVAYKDVKARLPKKSVKKLVDAQKSWLKTRELTCEISIIDKGTMYLISNQGCISRTTANRINELLWLDDLYTNG